ncbi:MAG: hypothetical protein OQK82_04555, partial [Candidatus Pacearchaeota archaeon]|nr:hypothetical protein [Candidatus Pacearchaeota archaeon]
MKKIHIFFLILIFFLVPTLIFGSGEKEKKFIVPKDAALVAYINIEEIINAAITPSLLDIIFIYEKKKPSGKSSLELLDEQLMRGIGIQSSDLKEITFFSLSVDMDKKHVPAGFHLVSTEDAIKKINLYFQSNYSPKMIKYMNTEFFQVKVNRQEIAFHTKGSNLFMAADPGIMKKMLDVAYGKDSTSNNKRLYNLINEYKTNTFYVLGYIPDTLKTARPYPFELMNDFRLNIQMNTQLSITLKIQTENAEVAEEFLTSIKGMIALSGMAVLSQQKSAYPLLQGLLKKINYEQKGSFALISAQLSEKDMKNISELVPVLLQMMR